MSAVISAERKVHFSEAVLNDLFDLFALRKEATGDARYLTAVTLEQLLESCLVTGAGRSHQRIICRFFKWVHKCRPGDRRAKFGRLDQTLPGCDFFQLMR